jgi:hypothetical protein
MRTAGVKSEEKVDVTLLHVDGWRDRFRAALKVNRRMLSPVLASAVIICFVNGKTRP